MAPALSHRAAEGGVPGSAWLGRGGSREGSRCRSHIRTQAVCGNTTPLLPENLSIALVWNNPCTEETCCHLLRRHTGLWVRLCHRERGTRKGSSGILLLDSSAAIKKGLCFSFSRASTPTSCTHPPTACVLCFYYGCSLR